MRYLYKAGVLRFTINVGCRMAAVFIASDRSVSLGGAENTWEQKQ